MHRIKGIIYIITPTKNYLTLIIIIARANIMTKSIEVLHFRGHTTIVSCLCHKFGMLGGDELSHFGELCGSSAGVIIEGYTALTLDLHMINVCYIYKHCT